METQTISLTNQQLQDTISVLENHISNLETTLAETHSGVDRFLIESVIANGKALLAHYQQFVQGKKTEPAEMTYDDGDEGI